jgi:hypothetical protein
MSLAEHEAVQRVGTVTLMPRSSLLSPALDLAMLSRMRSGCGDTDRIAHASDSTVTASLMYCSHNHYTATYRCTCHRLLSRAVSGQDRKHVVYLLLLNKRLIKLVDRRWLHKRQSFFVQ